VKSGDLLATNTEPERPARSYIAEAMAMTLEQRRELLASLPKPERELLKAHLLIQWEWKKYRDRQAKDGQPAGGGTPLDAGGSQGAE